jgi:hypothetical protein
MAGPRCLPAALGQSWSPGISSHQEALKARGFPDGQLARKPIVDGGMEACKMIPARAVPTARSNRHRRLIGVKTSTAVIRIDLAVREFRPPLHNMGSMSIGDVIDVRVATIDQVTDRFSNSAVAFRTPLRAEASWVCRPGGRRGTAGGGVAARQSQQRSGRRHPPSIPAFGALPRFHGGALRSSSGPFPRAQPPVGAPAARIG